MPEGPEIRYQREILSPYIINRTITDIKAFSKKKVLIPCNSKVLEVGTKGKLLWIKTKDYFIHIHLGMTGWLYIGKEDKYTKYIITLGNRKVYFNSVRKFSTLNIYEKKIHLQKLSKLGIDILKKEFTYSRYYNIITNRKMMITTFLLDQDKLSGIGNYQKSDVLYLAKIHPKAKTNDLTNRQIKDLYTAIKYIAYSSILTWLTNNNIKIPTDIKNNMPAKTLSSYDFYVYNKLTDQCGNKITSETIGGRGTYYVKKIQKL